MRYIKDGVHIQCMDVRLLDGILRAFNVYRDEGQPFTITSITDGAHMKGSLHYKGRAFDLRTRDIGSAVTPQGIAMQLRAALGKDWDVVVEATHLHIEIDPKT